MRLRWLGNSCVEIVADKRILIDPNYVVEPEQPIDIVLVTHEHSDHIDTEKLKKLEYQKLVAPRFVLENFKLEGLAAKPGDEIDGIRVFESWCWKAEESVSYYYAGVLHAGDSAKFPDVENVKVVFTACFPDFYSDYVAEMKRLKPELVVPIHFSPEKRKNAEGLKAKLEEAGIDCRILEIGESFEI